MLKRHWKRNRIFSDYLLCKIPYMEISALYLLYECIFFTHGYSRDIQKRKALLY